MPETRQASKTFEQTVVTSPTTYDNGAFTTRIGLNFIRISLIYFLAGAIWMGLGPWLPEPWSGTTYASSGATSVYDTVRVHVMVIGWASFALIGVLYYLVPRMSGKPLHSIRLAKIHFWVTIIVVPLAILVETYATFIIGSLMQSGQSLEHSMGSNTIAPFLLIYFIAYLVGLATQFIFAYNIYMTIRG